MIQNQLFTEKKILKKDGGKPESPRHAECPPHAREDEEVVRTSVILRPAGKDSIIPMSRIKRFKKAAAVAKGDNNEKKLTKFWLTLCFPCLKWFASLEGKPKVDISTLENAKKVFLMNYKPRYNAMTTCTNLHGLKQRPNESCHDLSIRINK